MRPEYTAALLHAGWLSQKEGKKVIGSLRARLASRAGASLNEVDYLILTGGHIWGQNYPTIAEVMRRQLLAFGVEDSRIIVQPTFTDLDGQVKDVKNTSNEISAFLELARQQSWKPEELLDVAGKRHHWTIPFFYKLRGLEVDRISSEDLIRQRCGRWGKRVVNWLLWSEYERAFTLYEGMQFFMLLFGKHQALRGTQTQRESKGTGISVNLFSKLKIDKYHT